MGGPGIRKLLICPRCKATNPAEAPACASCKLALQVLPPRSTAPAAPPAAPPPAGVVPAPLRATRPPTASPVAASIAASRQTTQRLTKADLLERLEAPPSPPKPPEKPPVPAQAATARPPVDPRKIVAWLSCDPLPPLPIQNDGVVTIGRSEESDFVLAHSSVSRVHAAIRFAGDALLFEDRSTFGSYVNGQRQVSATIKPGDVLTLGPYEVRVLAKEEVQAEKQDMSETRPLGAVLNLPSSDAMTGRLEKQPLAEVLQALEFNRKTGTLDLVCGELTGMLVVYEGTPIHASFGGLSGEASVHAMLSRKQGYYAFRTKVEPGEQTIEKSMTALLLEGSRLMDEGPDDDD